ncbi:MAG: TIGR03621 family F420-dependent LLM class oxidoreductase [Chloroflexota bacterium]|nr:TIGR03621 family F420-dependent LLM class oxidoreductase [Chloroflexota bacterium]
MRPFRFGVIGERVGDGTALIETAGAAEAAGYATFLLRDDLVAAPFGPQPAPLAALATVAAATTTLRIGTMVLANDFRHPAVLAKEAATLDLLSGGRFELGIGAGWLREEYARAGIPFDPVGVRIDRLEESLRVLKGLLGGGAFSFSGLHYAVDGLENFPAPVQRPRPPLLVGGGGKRMLGIAAREADVVGVMGSSVASGTLASDPAALGPERIAEKVGWVREAAGERFAEIELSLVASVAVAAHRRQAAERFAAERGWGGVGADEVLAMPTVLVGPVDAIVEDLEARRERYGFSYVAVEDAELAAFAPVVARLAGR